jgi:hypothetical protein
MEGGFSYETFDHPWPADALHRIVLAYTRGSSRKRQVRTEEHPMHVGRRLFKLA